MPALNFMERFAPLVESGAKRQTIRKVRKQPIAVGDRLYLYTGMRTKDCRKLGEGLCIGVAPVKMEINDLNNTPLIWIGDCPLNIPKSHALAHADGFETAAELFLMFYKLYGLPFEGMLIQWVPLKGGG